MTACAVLAGVLTAVLAPSAGQSREVTLAALVRQLPPRPAEAAAVDALDFCEAWSGLAKASLDCRTGLRLDTLTAQRSPQASQVWAAQLDAVQTELERLNRVAVLLEAAPDGSRQQTLGVLFSLRQRLDVWTEQWRRLKAQAPPLVGAAEYGQLFGLSLEVRGQAYDAGTGRLRRINWHVARLADARPDVLERAGQLVRVRQALPWLTGLLHAGLLLLGWWRARYRGLLLMGCFAWITTAGLYIVADAAIRFGDASSTFALNPLGNQLVRQVQVIAVCALLIGVVAVLAPRLAPVLQLLQRYWWLGLAGMVSAMVGGYVLQGPAMGAEMLKLGMALLAGLLMSAHGRAVYLSTQWTPSSLSPWRMLRCWQLPPGRLLAAQDMVAHELGRPVLQAAVFGAVGLALAALVFHDLGAALVTTLVALSLLMFVFGTRITAWVVLALGLMAVVLAQTQKVQQRVALMLDPLSASVSDFARLVAFTGAAGEHGFGAGRMAWCNPAGACVPLQSLSDYMPVILTGLLGWQGALAFFACFMLLLVLLGRSMLRAYLTHQGPGAVRVLALMALFLLVCTAAQTLITFLGNWRWIPLTGIGAPLLSIGLSSMLTPALAFGLILSVWSMQGETATAEKRAP